MSRRSHPKSKTPKSSLTLKPEQTAAISGVKPETGLGQTTQCHGSEAHPFIPWLCNISILHCRNLDFSASTYGFMSGFIRVILYRIMMVPCIPEILYSFSSACLCSVSLQEDWQLEMKGSSYTHQVPRLYFYLIDKKIVVQEIQREESDWLCFSYFMALRILSFSSLFIWGVFTTCKGSVSGISRDPEVRECVPAVIELWAWSLLCPSSIFAVISAQRAGSTLFWGLVPLQAAFSSSHPRSRLFKMRFPYLVKPGIPGATE